MLFEMLETCLLHQVVTFSNRRLIAKTLSGFIHNAKKEMNKTINYSIETAAARLLQLLMPNGIPFAVNEGITFDNVFHRNLFIDDEWGDDFEYIIHYSRRYLKDGFIGIQNYRINKSFQMALLDIMDNSSTIRSEDKIRILTQLISMENLRILLDTNPELPSRALLMLMEMNAAEQYIDSQIIDMFFEGTLHLIASVGIFNFGLNAIVNVIRIARYLHKRNFLYEMEELLDHKVFHRNPEFLSYIIYQYPEFVVSLIDLMPNLFFENYRGTFQDIIKPFFFRKKFLYDMEGKKALDYIRIFRIISLYIDKKSNYRRDMSDVLQHLARIILKSNVFNRLDFNQFTIAQIEDLIWLLESVDDVELSTHLKEKLNCSNIFHYVNADFFKATPKRNKKHS